MRAHGALLLVVITMLCQALAGVCGKIAAQSMPHFTAHAVVSNDWYLASLGFLGLQAVLWQLVMRAMPLARAYFFTGLNYVFILLASYAIFHEHLTRNNYLGAALIIGGVCAMASGKASELSATASARTIDRSQEHTPA